MSSARWYTGGMASIQLVPAALVPLVRSALQSQGIDPRSIDDSGAISGEALFALAFDKVEVRTAYTPNVTIDVLAPADPETHALLSRVQPTVILTGRGGRVVVAPYGEAGAIASGEIASAGVKLGLGVGAALLGLVFVGAALRR